MYDASPLVGMYPLNFAIATLYILARIGPTNGVCESREPLLVLASII